MTVEVDENLWRLAEQIYKHRLHSMMQELREGEGLISRIDCIYFSKEHFRAGICATYNELVRLIRRAVEEGSTEISVPGVPFLIIHLREIP